MAKVPSGPSKTGNPSGKGRGNLPAKKRAQKFAYIVGLIMLLPTLASAQQETGITVLKAEGSYICWGKTQPVKLFWSIYENDPIDCEIFIDEKCSFFMPVNGYPIELEKIAAQFSEWIRVAQQNNVSETWQKMPIDMSDWGARFLNDGYRNRCFEYLPCTGAYFMVKNGKMYCQIVFRAEKRDLPNGVMTEDYFNYGMQFESPEEVLMLADCLNVEWLNKLKWGDQDSALAIRIRRKTVSEKVDDLFK